MNPAVDVSQLPLRDIHLPGPVPWWPLATGWWLLAALVLLGIVAFALNYYLQRHRRAALAAVGKLRNEVAAGGDAAAALQRLSTLMRRFAMTTAQHGNVRPGALEAFDLKSVPGLVGERWLAYLDSRWERDDFSRGAGKLLTNAPYVRSGEADSAAALQTLALCGAWLAVQRRPWRSLLAAGPDGTARLTSGPFRRPAAAARD